MLLQLSPGPAYSSTGLHIKCLKAQASAVSPCASLISRMVLIQTSLPRVALAQVHGVPEHYAAVHNKVSGPIVIVFTAQGRVMEPTCHRVLQPGTPGNPAVGGGVGSGRFPAHHALQALGSCGVQCRPVLLTACQAGCAHVHGH